MNKYRFLSLLLLLTITFNLDAQTTIDDEISKALGSSYVSFNTSRFSKDVETIISLIYGGNNTAYQKYLLTVVINSFDYRIILDSIRTSIEEISSIDYLYAYNRFNETEQYAYIKQLERRKLSTEEKEKYRYADETVERKEIIKKLVDRLDIDTYLYAYLESIIVLVINLDESLSSSEKEWALTILKSYLSQQIWSQSSRELLFDIYTAFYHDVETLLLREYVEFIVSENMFGIYQAVYFGLSNGIIKCSDSTE